MSVVLLVWTDRRIRLPIAFRVWKQGGPSKFDLALEVLSYARNRIKCKPQFVLFDSGYPSKRLLKRIRDYGWYFVCQLKRNRCFERVPLHRYRANLDLRPAGFYQGRSKGGCGIYRASTTPRTA
jgi:hypothetical protein